MGKWNNRLHFLSIENIIQVFFFLPGITVKQEFNFIQLLIRKTARNMNNNSSYGLKKVGLFWHPLGIDLVINYDPLNEIKYINTILFDICEISSKRWVLMQFGNRCFNKIIIISLTML